MKKINLVGAIVTILGMNIGAISENIYLLLLNGFLYIGFLLLNER